MKLSMFAFLTLSAFGIGTGTSVAQTNSYAVTKEKIYAQTNHVFFKPGETVFFKLYVVNAQDQTPSKISKTVTVEIINPAGSSMEKLIYPVTDGYAEGSFDFGEGISGGIYQLKAYTSWMKNEKDSSFFSKLITVQKTIAPRILMKLDFPKKGYGAGETVIADYSMRNLNDEPIRNYEARFTVALSGKTILTGNLKTDKEGKSVIHFDLPADLNTNDGLLNITVDYDAFTENISRSIPIVLNNIDLQFMPEGGSLVSDITANVAFKALNEFGKPVDIKGEIISSSGKKVTDFDSYKFGMGKFSFTPELQETYYAKITTPGSILKTYPLPVVQSNGMVMHLEQDAQMVQVTISTKENNSIQLIGQTKNKVCYDKKIVLRKGAQTIAIPKNLFPTGIAQFTIYTSTSLPVAERLIFLNEDKNLKVSITTDKKQYLPREMVNLTIQTTNEKDIPVPSNFSVSVVDDKLWTFADDKQNHILSWLLLNSELKGKIEEPPFYFKKEEPKSIPALDLVMLTNGYRYFDFIEYVLNENKMKFTPDRENILSGEIVNEKGQPVPATVTLSEFKENGKAVVVKTNKNGAFFFSDLNANQQYFLISKSLQKNEKIKINVLQNGTGYNPVSNIRFNPLNANDDQLPAIRTLAFSNKMKQTAKGIENNWYKRQANIEELNNLNKNNLSESVVVVGYSLAQRKKDLSYSVSLVQAKELNEIRDLTMGLMGKVPGLQIQQFANPQENGKVMIRGNRSLTGNEQPLFIINGIPTINTGMLADFNPNDIDNITILKNGAATAIYGSAAANGAILIESKKFRNFKKFRNLGNLSYTAEAVTAKGMVYSTVKKFYVPKYESVLTEERSDFRETIYWNPVVQTDADGKAQLSFYNGDASTTFRAIAEGIGYNGVLGRTEKTWSVQNALSVDAKIPPYLTVGDKAKIPLIIKNNSPEKMVIQIQVQVPENVTAGAFTKQIELEPSRSVPVYIPIEATGVAKGNLKFIISSTVSNEKIILPIEAVHKGFSVVSTFSGNSSKEFPFSISKMIPGTLTSKLKLYNNLEGQLLDGIESMLREPYGCFEQTSSCTYPNIFVLKYLKESGKSNPEIVKKAMDYIDRGYKRLLGFETSENGFEWFGHTPPHEALTAYGLLEFTDMKEFIQVDPKMLERTKKFLLGRRDGAGSFKLATGGYDRFASVPNKIANIYIVYALTQAGIGSEIKPEYNFALKKAMESNDGYLLSMMALAASNMNMEKDYQELMNKLTANYSKFNLSSETSVVNSRDASLRVEALSLYAMALCRQKKPDLVSITEIISKILGEKSYYGYGSTQATVLALNAVVTFSKLAGKISKDTKIDFVLNDHNQSENTFMNTDFRDGKNLFAVHYTDESNKIPFNFEVAYQTYTPPNSEKADLELETKLSSQKAKTGETVRMDIAVKNIKSILQPMAIAKIGIPAGLSLQPWQLKEIAEKNEVAYYEIFDNYLVFYWMGFAKNETKHIALDLKVEIPGSYKAKASNVYLYYTPEYKHWADGTTVEIGE
jgi:TonB-dependent SusC/RagA subfamily outer membrane receptor